MSTRITEAWKLRHDLHAWLKNHPGSTMAEWCAAFPAIKIDTMRKAVLRLKADLNVAMTKGRANQGRYRIATDQVRSLDDTLKRLRTNTRNNPPAAMPGQIKKQTEADPLDDAIAQAREQIKALKAQREAKRIADRAAKKAAAADLRMQRAANTKSIAAKRSDDAEREAEAAELALIQKEKRGVWREDGSYRHVPGTYGHTHGGQGCVQPKNQVNSFHLF